MILVLVLLTVYYDNVTANVTYSKFSLKFKDKLRHFEEIASFLFYLNGIFIQDRLLF